MSNTASEFDATEEQAKRADELWQAKMRDWPDGLAQHMNKGALSCGRDIMARIVDWVKKNPGK
jgi:hypothetical protein